MSTSEPQSRISDPDFAKSSAPGWIPPAHITTEYDALQMLKREWRSHLTGPTSSDVYLNQKPVLVADLHDFEIYRTPNPKLSERDFELMSLHYWETPTYNSTIKLSFDGYLSIGAVEFYLEGVPVESCSIEGYGEDKSPNIVTYIQSQLAACDVTYDIWFRIGRPSRPYRRFHDPFICVAQLAKHVLDYVEEQPPCSVGLRSFRVDFHSWLIHRFAENVYFHRWHKEFGRRADFRVDVNAYRDLLFREAHCHPNSNKLLAHPIWGECMVGGLKAIKKQPIVSELTITTPNVYENFKHMYFGRQLRAVSIADKVKTAMQRRRVELGFAEHGPNMPCRKPQCWPYKTSQINVGDIVAFEPDEWDLKKWKNAEKDEWLAYVQSTENLRDGVQRLFVLHMYRPSDTHIGTAWYRFKNELFVSDNCNCQESQLLSTDVKGRYDVDWSPETIKPSKGYFARRTYITNDSAFVTLKEEHKTCTCRTRPQSKSSAPYKAGDTVYVSKTIEQEEILEPVVIRHINKELTYATVRILLRLVQDCAKLAQQAGRIGDLPLNELVLTDEYIRVPLSAIQRHCNVRHVRKWELQQGQLPFGYDRGGAGDLWTISMGVANVKDKPCLVYLARLSELFNEGMDFAAPSGVAPMVGLSMFSGGGNLDRGLEEGGAVEFQHAIDMEAPAIHTQIANAKDPSKLQCFYGSVDDYMHLLLEGAKHDFIALAGAVDFIAAGSPCPGFSTLQQDIFSKTSIEHASHITSFCSAVEVYHPKYAILENVVSMAYRRKGLEDQNVLSQLISCLVSMGYQVSQYIMDSYNYGSAQHRSRVFVSIAAPGLEPMKQLFHTHSRPWKEVSGRSLGKLPNGERFGQREWYSTPFQHISAGAIMANLPDIGNGNIQTCIRHPDHRLSVPSNHLERSLLACIPSEPAGCGYKEAFNLGLIPQHLQKPGREHGRGYKRIDKDKLVPTITTTVNCRDAHNGACVHWSQPRALTILDARRTQGVLDGEPIIGNRVEQYRIVGNGVDRKVSFALGLSLRETVMRNMRQELASKAEQELIMDIEQESDHFSDAT
ncbi:S-adenosyl-L-methionine-dependent methyltransferase [Phaeosphaeria sp. MPI-PUGE-AT-0046c]|nr:S-adenosyl-L-methionine-dependent methyltransferase [Phaeosphaeria sp. MPI-PUGE-AT-0046c]